MKLAMKNYTLLPLLTLSFTVMTSLTAFAAGWELQEGGWKYLHEEADGSTHYLTSCWTWIDGDLDDNYECYYFDEAGYMAADCAPEGYPVNADGAWTVDGVVQHRHLLTDADTALSFLFRDILAAVRDSSPYSRDNLYTLYDYDGDGRKDLIVQTGTCNADYVWEIYRIDADYAETELMTSFSGRNSTLYTNSRNHFFNAQHILDEVIIEAKTWDPEEKKPVNTYLYHNNTNDYDSVLNSFHLTPLPMKKISELEL